MAPARAAGGEDRWVVIACQSDTAWRSLCQVVDFADLAADASLESAAGRLCRADALDDRITGWNAARGEEAVQGRLVAAGDALTAASQVAHSLQVAEQLDCVANGRRTEMQGISRTGH